MAPVRHRLGILGVKVRLRDLRIWIQLLITIGVALAIVWVGVIIWQGKTNRDAAIDQARGFSLSMHHATMAGLTGMMVTGTVAQRGIFLDQVRQLPSIRDLRVLRAEGVSKTFGPGTNALEPDADEREVLASGRELVRVETDAKGEFLRAVRPTVASKDYLGKDCTTCHQVPEKTVLGVVSMKMSLDDVNAALGAQQAKTILVALLTCAPVLLIIYPFIQRVVTRPLEEAVSMAQRIAQGDLSARSQHDSGNETGRLLKALGDMAVSLSQVVSRVRSSSDTIAATTQQLSGGNSDLSARTEAQAQAVQSATQQIAQLTDAAHRNADGAQQADQMAQQASDVAVQGGKVVGRMVGTMDAIHESSRRIADISGVIDSIAFQTNILALNAAVEAARAGEQGRGFAVVASEVRHLAQRSSAAAQEIKTLIGTSVTEVEAGTALAHEAGKTMDAIVGSVSQVTGIMGEIASASRNQIVGVEQATASIQRIDEVTQRNGSLVQQAAAATLSLQDQAGALTSAVSEFQLSETTRG